MTDKITVEECTKSLTGYDELAIQRVFGKGLGELTGTMVPRSLMFVMSRREGAKDPDAYRMAMECPLGDLEDAFEDPAVLDEEKAPSGIEPSPTS